MAEEKSNTENTNEQTEKVVNVARNMPQGSRPPFERNKSKLRPKRSRRDGDEKEKDPFENKIIAIKRVSKMYKGGRRMKLSVFVVVGDKKGRVGLGLGKGDDVRSAQDKAVKQAKRNLILVPLKGNTIPHDVEHKFKAARVLMKPAAPGTGIVAGSSMRMIAEVAGVNDLLGKILGSNNNVTNAYATVGALKSLRSTRL
jgi:small subunit ribosomal protein S5